MNNIQVGEFIRTKDGVIAKVGEIVNDGDVFCDRDVCVIGFTKVEFIPPEKVDEYVIKHSFNIIDLIEVGDYVNGQRVYFCGTSFVEVVGERTYNFREIKSIVTKEQFKAMEYEVN